MDEGEGGMGDEGSNNGNTRRDSENVAINYGKNAVDAISQKIEEKDDAFDRIGNCIGVVKRNDDGNDEEEHDDDKEHDDDDDEFDERKKSSAQSRPGKGSNHRRHHET